jgi:hypothetical protein
MKTDKFDETIRQKLDSIEPTYRETYWKTLRQTLRQHGVVSNWPLFGGSLPVGGVLGIGAATVGGLLVLIYGQYRSNQNLSQSVAALSKTVARLEQTQNARPLPERDTIYVTREVMGAPVGSTPVDYSGSASANAPTNAPANAPVLVYPFGRGRSLAPAPTAPVTGQNTDNRRVAADEQTAQSTDLRVGEPANRIWPQSGIRTQSRSAERVARGPARAQSPVAPLPADNPTNERNDRERAARPATEPTPVTELTPTTEPARLPSERPAERLTDQRAINVTRRADRQRNRVTAKPYSSGLNQRANVNQKLDNQPMNQSAQRSVAGSGVGVPVLLGRAIESVALLSNRPVQIETPDVQAGIDRRVRRLRYLFPAITPSISVAGASEAAVQPASSRVSLRPAFRLGASGAIDNSRQSAGIYGEGLIGPHLVVGLGLEHVNWAERQFQTDDQFRQQTKRDFRDDYARNVDRRDPIVNIDQRSQSWQIPVSVGYRIGLGKGFWLTPTAGASLAISAEEQITFTYFREPNDPRDPNDPRGPRIPNMAALKRNPPTGWYNGWSLGLGLEKSGKRWTVQAMPYLSAPFGQSPNGFNTTAGGMRLRVLYGF